jgi:hypothetical protein
MYFNSVYLLLGLTGYKLNTCSNEGHGSQVVEVTVTRYVFFVRIQNSKSLLHAGISPCNKTNIDQFFSKE